MGQSDLFDSTGEQALEDCVFAVGGWQKAAALIWTGPDDCPVEKGRYLRQALDPKRREKLSEAERERLIKAGAAHGCLTPVARVCAIAGCGCPEKIAPEVAEAQAYAIVEKATDALSEALAELKRTRTPRVVA